MIRSGEECRRSRLFHACTCVVLVNKIYPELREGDGAPPPGQFQRAREPGEEEGGPQQEIVLRLIVHRHLLLHLLLDLNRFKVYRILQG